VVVCADLLQRELRKSRTNSIGEDAKSKPAKRVRRKSIASTEKTSKEVYYLGIIDILVQYNLRKRGEYMFKSKVQGLGDRVSCVPPKK
jgi:hypothetical protein